MVFLENRGSRRQWFYLFLFCFVVNPIFGEVNGLAYDKNKLKVDNSPQFSKTATNLTEFERKRADLFARVDKYEKQFSFGTARELLVRHLKLYPNDYEATLYMGWLFYLEKNYAEAEAWYDLAIEISPQQVDGYQGKMSVLLGKKDLAGALKVGYKILSLEPSNCYAASQIGGIFFERNRYQEAMYYYGLCPSNPECKLGLGLCHFFKRDYSRARPLLYESIKDFPNHQKLKEAVFFLQKLEVSQLKSEIANAIRKPDEAQEKKNRLAEVFEMMNQCEESAEFLVALLPKNPSFQQIVRVAYLLKIAGFGKDAGKYYEWGAAFSPNPRETKLAAVDAYIEAKEFAAAESILNSLAKEKPGFDLDRRFALIFMQTEGSRKGQEIFRRAARYYERMGAASKEPRKLFLEAADLYLDGRLYLDAKFLLEQMTKIHSDFETDRRWARYYFEEKSFGRVIEICDRYPDSREMQLLKGLALANSNLRKQARDTLKTYLADNPSNKEARQAFSKIKRQRPWNLGLFFATLEYGQYRDAEHFWHGHFSHNFRDRNQAVLTLAYSRTRSVRATPGKFHFQENMSGMRMYYKLHPRWALQVHWMGFDQNDPTIGDGGSGGAAVYWYPYESWAFGLEGDNSNFGAGKATQLNPWVLYKVDPHLQIKFKGCFIHTAGSGFRPSQPDDFISGQTTLSILPNERTLIELSAWCGDRILEVDSDNLFVYNLLDKHRNSASVSTAYSLYPYLKLFGKYSLTTAKSESISKTNEATGVEILSPHYTLRYSSFGIMCLF